MTGANTSIYSNKNVASLATPSTHESLKTSTVADTKSDMSALSTKPSTFSMHDDSNIDHKAVDRDCEAWKETGAKMYLRVLTGSQAHPFITTKALVDTGDLGPSLVSDKFAKYMQWQICPTEHKVAQAVNSNSAPVLGRTKALSFCLENFPQVFTWRFVVIKDLFTPMIFGYDWLTVHNTTIQLDLRGNNFLHVNKVTSLNAPLINQAAPIMPPGGKWAGAKTFKQKRGGDKLMPP